MIYVISGELIKDPCPFTDGNKCGLFIDSKPAPCKGEMGCIFKKSACIVTTKCPFLIDNKCAAINYEVQECKKYFCPIEDTVTRGITVIKSDISGSEAIKIHIILSDKATKRVFRLLKNDYSPDVIMALVGLNRDAYNAIIEILEKINLVKDGKVTELGKTVW